MYNSTALGETLGSGRLLAYDCPIIAGRCKRNRMKLQLTFVKVWVKLDKSTQCRWHTSTDCTFCMGHHIPSRALHVNMEHSPELYGAGEGISSDVHEHQRQ